MSWLLRLVEADTSFPANGKVAGLTLPLRMALAAQAGGAIRVELAEGALACKPLLEDARLKIPVTAHSEQAATQDAVVEVPWNLAVHRDLFRKLSEHGLHGTRRLASEPFSLDQPFAFEPISVLDRASARRAEKALFYSLRKPQDGWTSTYLNRYISLFFTRWLAHTPLHPNQVSIGILGVGILGAYLASRGTYMSMFVGALLFQAQSVLDGCDGELSRITYQGSRTGEWLDTVGDDLTNYGFFAGTAWGLYSSTHSPLYLVAGAVTVLCGVITSTIEYRYLIRIGSGDLLKYPLGIGKAPGADTSKGSIARVLDSISPLFKRDTFVFMTLLGAAAGLLGPFLIIFAIGGIGILITVIKAEMRMKSR